MRLPLAPAGRREMLLLTLVFGGGGALCLAFARHGHPVLWGVGALLGIVWLAGLAFFRDPERQLPAEAGILVAPADGKVTEITRLDHHDEIGGPALRIGIFLSVFDVHINRSPCEGVVKSVRYQKGKFLDARHPDSGTCNESNTIVFETAQGPAVVRQVAGLIARRIVCPLQPGDRVQAGQRIGLIKFGSRTELIVPFDRFASAVQVGDKVAGAATIIARSVQRTDSESARELVESAERHV